MLVTWDSKRIILLSIMKAYFQEPTRCEILIWYAL